MHKIKPWFGVVLLVLAMMGLNPAAFAKHAGGGHGKKNGDTPHGWTQGKKKGWHGEKMPPGLAKKSGAASEKKDNDKDKDKDKDKD